MSISAKGWYKINLPAIPGGEGAGVVEAVGAGVTEAKPGDRVAWMSGLGCYATHCLAPGDRLVVLPAAISFEQGAAAMIQGMTAHVLATRTYPLKRDDWALVHAAAGGVGLLLTQIAKMQGAQVIGTVSTEEKAKLAREAGADEVVIYTQQDFLTEVKRITGGVGVQVAYDSVGKDTFDKSLDSLAPLGTMVSLRPVERFSCRRWISSGSAAYARCSLRGRHCSPTFRIAPIICGTPTPCSTWWSVAGSRCVSAPHIRWRKRLRPISRCPAGRRPGRCC